MVAGNVVDRSPPFSTINKLGVTNVSSSHSCFVHIALKKTAPKQRYLRASLTTVSIKN